MARRECISGCLVVEHDGRGRSLPVYFRIPPVLASEIYRLQQSARLPFQTKEELARYIFCAGALSLRFKEIEYSSPILELPFILYKPCDPAKVDGFFIDVARIVSDLKALGYRTPELHKFVGAVEDLVSCLPSSYEREIYLKAMERRWPYVVDSADWPAHPSKKGYRAR